MDVNKPNKYFAFISYNHEDEGMAIWFQHEMENYHLPVTLNGRTDLPTKFRPVFRDYDELKAGNLPKQIYEALASSTYLVVICSPHSAQSKWVNKEITDFIAIGKEKGINNSQNIFPFIVEGKPHAEKESDECYPPSLLDIAKEHDILGGDANKEGNDHAFVKVLAAMLPNVSFDELWNRYERDKAEEQRIERERRDNLLQLQSRFVAEKAMDIAEDDSYLARLLAVEVLPEKLDNPNRPYTVEAEKALRSSCLKRNTMLRGHNTPVKAIFVNPDGIQLMSVSVDNTLKKWNLCNGSETSSVKVDNPSPVFKALFNIDGSKVITISGKSISIHNTETGECVCRFTSDEQVKRIYSIAISPDNSIIAAGVSYDNISKIELWDTAKGVRKDVLHTGDQPYLSLNFNQDGTRLAATNMSDIYMWDLRTKEIEYHTDTVDHSNIVTFNYDGDKIAYYNDKYLTIYDIANKRETKLRIILLNFLERPTAIDFSKDGKFLLAASNKGTVKLWRQKGSEFADFSMELNCASPVNQAVFSDDASLVISAHEDAIIRVWENINYSMVSVQDIIHTPSLLHTEERFTRVVYSSDGEMLAAGSKYGALMIWKSKTRELLFYEHVCDSIDSLSFSNDSKFIIYSSNKEGVVIVQNVQNPSRLSRYYCFHHNVWSIAFNPNDKSVVSGSEDGSIKMTKKRNMWKKESYCFPTENSNPVLAIAFSPNGENIAAASGDVLTIWDLKCNQIQRLTGNLGVIRFVSYSNDGRYLLSVASDYCIKVWDLKENTSRILSGHVDIVECACFSADGKYIASASDDFTIKIWNAEQGECIMTMDGHQFWVNSVDFSPDGRQLVSASGDGTIRIWDFPPLQELIDQTRERFKDRPLTKEEKEQCYLE